MKIIEPKTTDSEIKFLEEKITKEGGHILTKDERDNFLKNTEENITNLLENKTLNELKDLYKFFDTAKMIATHENNQDDYEFSDIFQGQIKQALQRYMIYRKGK